MSPRWPYNKARDNPIGLQALEPNKGGKMLTNSKQRLIRSGRTILLSVVACTMGATTTLAVDASFPDLHAIQSAFVKISKALRPSVVAITGYRHEIDENHAIVSVPFNHGSGFVIHEDGLIATNFHVVDDVDLIEVALSDGRRFTATVFGSDYRADLAVIKINVKGLQAVKMAKGEQAEPGQWVITLGNPLGFAGLDGNAAVSVGIVSATGKSLTGKFGLEDDDRYYGNMIQTTLSFPPGQSGGAVFNMEGEVIGIATATFSADDVTDGTSFALPLTERVTTILNRLSQRKTSQYGFLGVTTKTMTVLATQEMKVPLAGGARITEVSTKVAHQPVSMMENDVITQLAGEPIYDTETLEQLSKTLLMDEVYSMVFYRNGVKHETNVTMSKLTVVANQIPVEDTRRILMRTLTWHGTQLAEPTPTYRQNWNMPRTAVGLHVAAVSPLSPFASQGLKYNTMIVRYNGKSVRTLEDFIKVDDEAKGSMNLEFQDGKTLKLNLITSTQQ